MKQTKFAKALMRGVAAGVAAILSAAVLVGVGAGGTDARQVEASTTYSSYAKTYFDAARKAGAEVGGGGWVRYTAPSTATTTTTTTTDASGTTSSPTSSNPVPAVAEQPGRIWGR